MNGSTSKNILADFYKKDFKVKSEPIEENCIENSDSSSDEDFVCGSSSSGKRYLNKLFYILKIKATFQSK
jgi:hypothetical protein